MDENVQAKFEERLRELLAIAKMFLRKKYRRIVWIGK